jgi:lysozyme
VAKPVLPEIRQGIEGQEGVVFYAYDDADPSYPKRRLTATTKIRGTITIGAGHTGSDVKWNTVWSQTKVDAALDADLGAAEEACDRVVTVPINDWERGAIVDMMFNNGIAAISKSTMIKKLNNGDYNAVPTEMAKWIHTKIDGKTVVSKGLVARRAFDMALWSHGAASSPSAVATPVPPAWVSKENVAAATPLISGVLAAASGPGPLQWALAAIFVIAGAAAAYLFVQHRVNPK